MKKAVCSLALLVSAASCAAPHVNSPSPFTDNSAKTNAQARAVATGSPRPAHKNRPAAPERAPEVGITTPMKGEPSAAALKEAHLEATSCEKAAGDEVEAQLRAMRAAVNASLKEWADEQPECWEEMREEWRAQHSSEASAAGKPLARAAPEMREALMDASDARGNMWGGGLGLGSLGSIGHGAGTATAAPKAAVRSAAPPARARSTSGTNNQVATVDEADIVKTDGTYMYFASGGALRIATALQPKVVSVTPVTGSVREMLVEGDRAVIYTSLGQFSQRCTYGYDCQFAGDGSQTKVSIFDIKDRAHPKIVREIDLTGSLVASRRIGNAVHTVVADGDSAAPTFETWPDGLDTCGTPDAVVKAKFAKLRAENERRIRARAAMFPIMTEKGKATPLCQGLLRTAMHDGRSFTSVVSLDLADDNAPPTTATMQSRPGAVFASADALYLSVVHDRASTSGRWYSYYASTNEVSEIHKFKIGGNPRDTKYIGSGTVPGHVLNQFAMDEWYGYLRIATTKGRVPDPNVSSTLSILAETPSGNLTRIGAIDKIAPGEDIRSVRFDGDRGYVVTFKKTDPLFVLDLYKVTQPKILGELKIPGFSTYMHRIDPDHLLSIGLDANDHGDFAYFDGVILQLFDVKNPTDPRLLHKEKIGTRGSSSEALTNHLAFNYHAREGLLAIPMTICEGGGDGSFGNELAFSGLLVYDVDYERGFTRLGGVNHGDVGADCQTWWSNAKSAVKRSVFVDDLVYSIASDKAKVQRLDHFGVDVAEIPLGSEN